MSKQAGSGSSLLERLARFIRHPTTDWSHTRHARDPAIDKAKEKARRRETERALRAATLVRDREFDVLRREMRNHRAQSAKPLEGLSIPSTLPPPLPAVSRHHTVHKIDAIERQIQGEQQRQFDATALATRFGAGELSRSGFGAFVLRPGSQRHSTTPRWRQSQILQSEVPRKPLRDRERAGRPPGIGEMSVLPLPAVIELASFDFAEGRDAEVESQLLTGLQTAALWSADAQQIFQALLDFYWATGQQDKLQARSLDYVRQYGQTPLPRPQLGEPRPALERRADFVAAEQFDILQLRAFERFVADSSAHLVLDWTALVSIPDPQRVALTQALCALNGRPVKLELFGVESLLSATRLQSSTLQLVDADLRLEILRLVGDEAAFVDLAVERAIACACSPVDWVPPRHQRFDHVEQRATTPLSTLIPNRLGSLEGDVEGGFKQITVRLSGYLSGPGEAFLRNLRTQARHADAVTVELDSVQRIDFASATGLLNWTEAQVQLGKTVEVGGAHLLLQPFLQSIGLQIKT